MDDPKRLCLAKIRSAVKMNNIGRSGQVRYESVLGATLDAANCEKNDVYSP
jgi:hypothetical protein